MQITYTQKNLSVFRVLTCVWTQGWTWWS